MKILVACEESQRVCTAFREKGHEAYSCDILPCSGGHPEWHIKGDVLPLLNGRCEFVTVDGVKHCIDSKWDMIIAHPPCTFITAASACRMYPQKGQAPDFDRLMKMLDAVKFFNSILFADCKKICIENPRPLKIAPLVEPTQYIQPYMWRDVAGEDYTKFTYLWLKGLPTLVPHFFFKSENTMPYVNAGCKTASGEYRKKQGCSHSAKDRSKTFLGIAKAMAEQWG